MHRIDDVRSRFHELLLGRDRERTCVAIAGLTDGNRTVSPHVLDRATCDRRALPRPS